MHGKRISRKETVEQAFLRARRIGVANMQFNRDPETMRPVSLELARAQRDARPIDVDVYPDAVVLADGRHRLQAAIEAGATHLRARITVYGPRGARLARREETLPIRPAK